mmetsp:Transcript_52741/g.136651  ORF Transcript_52741/g.136651 Transcript_52741/m.136651 type:complete len:219 (-) Transcript_52741:653-1309(-)
MLEEFVEVAIALREVEASWPTPLHVCDEGAATHGQRRRLALLRSLGAGIRSCRACGGDGRRSRGRGQTVQWAEKMCSRHDSLVPQCDMELCLRLHFRLEVTQTMHDADASIQRGDRELLPDHDTSLQLLRIQPRDAHRHAVALDSLLHTLSELLQAPHLLALALLAQAGHVDDLARLDRAREHRACHHRALAFDGKGVVERKHKRASFVSLGHLQVRL